MSWPMPCLGCLKGDCGNTPEVNCATLLVSLPLFIHRLKAIRKRIPFVRTFGTRYRLDKVGWTTFRYREIGYITIPRGREGVGGLLRSR